MGILNIRLFTYLKMSLWALLVVGSTTFLDGADLHVVIVGDTAAKDLQSSVLIDLQSIENHAYEIARHTGLTPRIQRHTDYNARSQPVLRVLNALEPQPDDVVLFYFSGHGYRTPAKEGNPWPNIYFATDQTGIDLYEIGNILNGKGARLVLVFADCCNSSLPNHLAPPVAKVRVKPQPNDELLGKNIRKLILGTDGFVLVASSKAGQPSWSINKAGSLYTCAFTDTMKYYLPQVKTDILDWQQFLDQVAYKTHQIAKSNGIGQDPIYSIQLN